MIDPTRKAGLFVSFQQLFSHYHIGWLTNVMGLLAAFGALAGLCHGISGPSRGLLWTANDGQLPDFLKTNRNGVQTHILYSGSYCIGFIFPVYHYG